MQLTKVSPNMRVRLGRRTFLIALLLFLPTALWAQIPVAPVFSPSNSTSLTVVTVTITCATSGATIRYTTNGQTPSVNDPSILSGGTLSILGPLTLKAAAFNASNQSSAVTSAIYPVTGMVSAGAYHALGLKSDGTLYAWGDQTSGGLGNGNSSATNMLSPTQVMRNATTAFSNATFVAAGDAHTLVLLQNGTLWAFGRNTYGALGNNSTVNSSYPVQVMRNATDVATEVLDAAAGQDFSVAAAPINSTAIGVGAWGRGTAGRLGNGATADQKLPVIVRNGANDPIVNIAEVAAGKDFAAALTSAGKIWMWGANGAGQLGTGGTVNQLNAGYVNNGIIGTDFSGAVAVALGEDHSVTIRSNSTENYTVWCWGNQQYGAVGNGNLAAADIKYPQKVDKVGGGSLENIVQIDAGAHLSLALNSTGSVWAWGRNNRGALGTGNTTDRALAGQVSIPGNPEIVWISAGGLDSGYCLALAKNGTLFGWGNNGNGTMGNGTLGNGTVLSPITGATILRFSNQPPSGTLTISGAPYKAPATATLNVSAADPDGNSTVARVDFLQSGNLVGTDSTSPYSQLVTGLSPGNYTFSAVVTDNVGTPSSTNTANITVLAPTVSVTALASPISETSATPATFRLSRNASDNLSSSLSINYIMNGTATNGVDYQTIPGSPIAIPAGNTSIDLSLQPVPDLVVDGNETAKLTITPTAGAYAIGTSNATITITDVPVALTIISGNNQVGVPGTYLDQPLVVEARNGAGGPLLSNNSPVVFGVTSGGGGLALQFGNATANTTITVNTNSTGRASAFYRLGDVSQANSTITAEVGNSTAVTFSERATQSDGLFAHWQMNEGNGTNASEHTGFHANGTLVNQTEWSGGFDGRGAVKFSGPASLGGTNAYVTMGNSTSSPLDFGSGSFSISLWTKFTEVTTPSGQNGRRIVSKGHSGWNSGYFVGLHGTGQITTGIGSTINGNTTEALLFGTTSSFNDGKWHHVAVVFDRAAATGQIFIDGTAQSLTQMPSPNGPAGGTINGTVINYSGLTNLSASRPDKFFTVSSTDGTVDFFKGEVDDLRVFRTAIDAAKVTEIRNFDGNTNGLPDYWEWKYFDHLGIDPQGNPDGDPLTNRQEYEQGSDPLSYVSQGNATVTPVASVDSGNNQTGLPGEYLDQPLVVLVRNGTDGAPLPNASVSFLVTSGSGALSSEAWKPSSALSLSVKTDANGRAGVFYRQGFQTNVNSTLVATTIGSQTVFSSSTSFTTQFAPQMKGGGRHCLMLDRQGLLFTWGLNSNGQLGHGDLVTRSTPTKVSGFSAIKNVSAGYSHTLIVAENGQVWSWGGNNYGQLGDGTNLNRTQPVIVPGITDAVKVAAGESFSLALKTDGSVWAWGNGGYGQLGNGTTSSSSVPVPVSGLGSGSGVVSIAAGRYGAFALLGNGSLVGWGRNDGALGDGTTVTKLSPVPITSVSNVTSVAMGDGYSMALKADGTIAVSGVNWFGQLGLGHYTGVTTFTQVPGLTGIRSISCGYSHSLAVTTNGALYAWGYNNEGQVGDGSQISRLSPTLLASQIGVLNASAVQSSTYAVRNDGTTLFWGWGRNQESQVTYSPGGAKYLSPVIIQFGYPDSDTDWIPDWIELRDGSNSGNPDTNGDQVSDSQAIRRGLSVTSNDVDGDGISNTAEIAQGTNPFRVDSDFDLVNDDLDIFPTDSARSSLPFVPGDSAAPVIQIVTPSNAILLD